MSKPQSLSSRSSGEELASHAIPPSPGERIPPPAQDELDPTLDFFYHSRTITVLAILVLYLTYKAFDTAQESSVSNTKTYYESSFLWFYGPFTHSSLPPPLPSPVLPSGIYTAAVSFILIGTIQLRDGPFIRPHPALWKAVQAISILYQMALTILLFQNKADGRRLMTYLDPSLGSPLPERSYADNCTLTWDVMIDQMDAFVLAHSIGWFCKSLILRDYWFCWILSVLFEVMEYSLEHQLPNFSECWWDHWILDVLVCNWLGIYLGMKTCEYFEMKQYSWRGIKDIPTYKGKLRRSVQQFTPHSWTKFEWRALENWRNYFGVIGLLFTALVCELNAFYLKYLLWIPPVHWINVLRLVIFFLCSIPGVRELYQYMSDPNCKRLGAHTWLQLANLATEVLIIVKFSDGEFPKPMPTHIKILWAFSLISMVGYGFYKFYPWSTTSSSQVKKGKEE
ncbi:MAG: phosphatidyl serine synthase-domain-containing protein [Piptocephalis tieghemiana]|nr:MAG: phosphatidyl serine synthase-domain-containing protein [Piptocephalis tieghemiana]